MTESLKKTLEVMGMTEAEWKIYRANKHEKMMDFINTLREANKKSSTTKIRYGNKK